MSQYNEIGTKNFHVKRLDGEFSLLALAIGLNPSVRFEASQLRELINLLTEAERLFGLEKATTVAGSIFPYNPSTCGMPSYFYNPQITCDSQKDQMKL